MKTLLRIITASACLMLATPAVFAHDAAQQMADAAAKFVDSLTPELRAKAVFDFKSEERTHWEFVPKIRTGLTIKMMNDAQKLAAFTLLASGLSPDGMGKATNIMSLDIILKELEAAAPKAVRDPELYYVSVYGKPGAKDTWSWRFEGHHLSVNFTIVDGQIVATPEFFGSNPAEVLNGPRKGLRVLSAEEDSGFALFNSLTDDQKKIAIYTDKTPAEIITGNKRKVEALEKVGLPASKMTPEQKARLVELIKVYSNHHRAEVAADDLAAIEKGGWDNVYFGCAGGTEKGTLHYYRVQGPSFLLELDSVQGGNHIHAAWHSFDSDFGGDLLAEHYKQTPHDK